MANITGIVIKTFPKSGTTIAELNVLRPVETVISRVKHEQTIHFAKS